MSKLLFYRVSVIPISPIVNHFHQNTEIKSFTRRNTGTCHVGLVKEYTVTETTETARRMGRSEGTSYPPREVEVDVVFE